MSNWEVHKQMAVRKKFQDETGLVQIPRQCNLYEIDNGDLAVGFKGKTPGEVVPPLIPLECVRPMLMMNCRLGLYEGDYCNQLRLEWLKENRPDLVKKYPKEFEGV